MVCLEHKALLCIAVHCFVLLCSGFRDFGILRFGDFEILRFGTRNQAEEAQGARPAHWKPEESCLRDFLEASPRVLRETRARAAPTQPTHCFGNPIRIPYRQAEIEEQGKGVTCYGFWESDGKLEWDKGKGVVDLALICFTLRCFALLCIALLCFSLLCFALHCFALACFALFCFALHCFALHCFALLCITLLCIDLFCIALL